MSKIMFKNGIGQFVAGFFLVLSLVGMSVDQASARLPEFKELVKRVSPAVVNITTTRESKDRQNQYDLREIPDFLRRFIPRGQEPRSGPAAGSGFIISADGYILTNNHVVDGADKIVVALSDRREREAKVIGADPLSDLALLKIDEEHLPTIEFGSSEALEVGEWVLAIGSPFGFQHSVTQGIVSAKGRSLQEGGGRYVPFIQTDVAINPGNSGGPLLNLDGKVVGINSQILTRSGGYMGLSFAIPIDVAVDVVEQLKEKGSVSRGWLGVGLQGVDRDLAESFGLDRPSGALITQVFADSPAEEAGLREGDIILEFDGQKIDLSADLPHVVGRIRPDTEVDVRVIRDGNSMNLTVKVGMLEESQINEISSGSGPVPGNRLGIDVEELNDEEKSRLEIKRGVLVRRVTQGPGTIAGVQVGDVITTIDSQWVDNEDEFESIVRKLDANIAVPLRIVRNQQPQFLVVKIVE
jgi:serine protease Do